MKHLGEHLMQELINDPKGFFGRGDTYKLLNECFGGFPVERLRFLIANPDRDVRRATMWIVSELGNAAFPLIDEVVKVVNDSERYVRVYALESIAVCAVAQNLNKYIYVVRALEDADQITRVMAMFLISNADVIQLEAAMCSMSPDISSYTAHKKGLSIVAKARIELNEIAEMIVSTEKLMRKYGAIAAWRCNNLYPQFFTDLCNSDDPDLKEFWKKRRKH